MLDIGVLLRGHSARRYVRAQAFFDVPMETHRYSFLKLRGAPFSQTRLRTRTEAKLMQLQKAAAQHQQALCGNADNSFRIVWDHVSESYKKTESLAVNKASDDSSTYPLSVSACTARMGKNPK